MVKAVQFIVIAMAVSNNTHNHVKTLVHDSGIILESDKSTISKVKHDYEGAYDNTTRVGDTYYTAHIDGVLYKIHRYEYVARVAYHC